MKNFENEKHLLNYDEIDELHREFLDIYNSVDSSSIDSYIQKLTALLQQSKRHFNVEEELMDKYSYPRSREHKDEHRKVLAEMQYFINNTNSLFGKKMLKAYYNEKLGDWFDLHLLSMDSDLTAFLKKVENGIV
ncbi:bacteriohemerythrin [Halarcobacter ebronensis]|uniref:Hemerythrin n=1 Tax=Halarcobacter ebronensis TaxID=1462615 RepID=A0A4Q1AND0_9BACT|nr:hemerythrin family protein [Halarcobacter ebronensis]QKF82337.1 hemerythrin [Halarcobacter ebronensis]RXK07634.1 hemerythrin [Halarcobacter ebronensis]